MATPVIVPTAALAPGVCFLSGDHNGPFIDTTRSIRGVGRVYLSLKAVGPLVREAGWVPKAEVEADLDEIGRISSRVAWEQERSELYGALVEAISPLLPTPDPIVKQVAVPDKNQSKTIEKLTAKIDQLEGALAATQKPAPDAAEPAPISEGSASVERGSAATTVTVNGGVVNVDDLLQETAQTVLSVVDGWPDDALAVVVLTEMERPQPRKTILGLAE